MTVAPTASATQRNAHCFLGLLPSASLPSAWEQGWLSGPCRLSCICSYIRNTQGTFLETGTLALCRETSFPLGMSAFLSPQISVCRSTMHTNCLFGALLQRISLCTSQKIALSLRYSAGTCHVTESLAIMHVNNSSFKCSLGMPENE